MAGPSCCERYDEFLLDQPRVRLFRAAFLVTPDSPFLHFGHPLLFLTEETGLSGV
jgi:hypothetical protein